MTHDIPPETPLVNEQALADAIGTGRLFLKREDLHRYGSHKGRSIPAMIEKYAETGDRRFGISSSGNAALAAALYVREFNSKLRKSAGMSPIDLSIYIGTRAAPKKAMRLKELENGNIKVWVKERPMQAMTVAAQEGVRSLRQSLDDAALVGYASLADELMAEKNVSAVFVGTSSGTTAQALAQAFQAAKRQIQVHFVQTSSCHPMSAASEQYDGPHELSIADAIVDTVAMRKPVLIPLVSTTGGRGWTVTNDKLSGAIDMIATHCKGLEVTANGALGVAGLIQATELGYDLGKGAAVCIVGGE